MKRKSSNYVAAFFLLVGLFGIIQSANFHYWESMTLPLIASSLVFILATIQLGLELHHQRKKDVVVTDKTLDINNRQNNVGIKIIWIIFGWAAGFSVATYLFGFYLAVPFFCFTYLKCSARSWLSSIIFAIIMFAGIYLIFSTVLKTPLFAGLIFSTW